MKKRCYNITNKDYKHYGERGVEVCDRWSNSFPNFLEDMGEKPSQKHSLDREDNDGDYTPENCRWATKTQQNINQRVRKNASGYTGVVVNRGKWKSRVSYKGKVNHIGTYDTIEEAVKSRNSYIIKNNLPHKIQEYG